MNREQTSSSKPAFPAIADQIDGEIAERVERARFHRDELDRLGREIAQLRQARDLVAPSGSRSVSAGLARGEPPGPGASDAALIRFHAANAIRAAGRPLNRAEIFDYLKREGVSLATTDPVTRIGKVLWRAKDFVSEADGYWPQSDGPPSPSS